MVEMMTDNEIALAIIQSLKERRRTEFQDIVDELQPYDVAQQYKLLPGKHQNKFLLYLTLEQMTDMIQELDQTTRLQVLHRLGFERTSEVLDLMENDEVTSFMSELDPERVEELLSEMRQEESSVVQNMMTYPEETAGRLMNNRFVWIPEHYTIRQAVDKLKDFAALAEYLNYLYVVDADKRLVGVISYKDLILAEIDDAVADVMYKRVVKVDVMTDQEEVAKLINRYDFISIPVVEDGDRLVGIITVDDVLDIVIQEANEDIEKLSASGKAIDFDTKPLVVAYRRSPSS